MFFKKFNNKPKKTIMVFDTKMHRDYKKILESKWKNKNRKMSFNRKNRKYQVKMLKNEILLISKE